MNRGKHAALNRPALSGQGFGTAVTERELSCLARPACPPSMTPMSPRHAATAVKAATAIVAPLACGLAVLGGIGSFATIRRLAQPWFSSSAWIIPVGVDLGILALLAWDLLTEYVGLPWPALRWTAWAFIAATIYLNITAANGTVYAAVMHAAMPVLFITVIEGIRHLIRQWTGLAAGSRIEPIPLVRWLFAPRSSFLLARHMALWHVTSYRQALALEHRRLQAIARLQERHGHYLWRWRAPLHDRLALRPAPAPSVAGVNGGTPATHHSPVRMSRNASLVRLLPRQCLIAPPSSTVIPVSERDRSLIETAAAILRDADRRGRRLSQAALARQIRAQGQPIANERLRWLMTAARRPPRPCDTVDLAAEDR